jgi:hypothetical protein
MMKRLLAVLTLMALGTCLSACGGGGNRSQEPTSTIPPTPIVTTAAQPTETPVATVESKYDEAWARKQVEPLLEETYEMILAQDSNKLYDLYPDEARAGCSRSTFASKMAGLWLLIDAFGGGEVMKAKQQDLREGKLVITFSEITPERITYTVGDDEPATIVREKGKWTGEYEPLGQDCASLDMDMGE